MNWGIGSRPADFMPFEKEKASLDRVILFGFLLHKSFLHLITIFLNTEQKTLQKSLTYQFIYIGPYFS